MATKKITNTVRLIPAVHARLKARQKRKGVPIQRQVNDLLDTALKQEER